MQIFLDVNGTEVKINWQRSPTSPVSQTYSVNARALSSCSSDVRLSLKELNAYTERNPAFAIERDPGWKNYSAILSALRKSGAALRAALIDAGSPENIALDFEKRLASLPEETLVTVHCSDQAVTIPFGFLFDGNAPLSIIQPSRADFDGFWINKYNINVRLNGPDVETSNALDKNNFRAIYAFNRAEKDDALAELVDAKLDEELQQFESLTTIDQRDHYDWINVGNACKKIEDNHVIFFVFAHHDNNSLDLGCAESKNWADLKKIFRTRSESSVRLVIFNCCASAVGGEGGTLLSSVVQQGYCGLIGTEAEINNVGAMRCGIRLMWHLCAKGRNLGDAFEEMQNSDDLFPSNLLYTCYAARDFRLNAPIQFDARTAQ